MTIHALAADHFPQVIHQKGQKMRCTPLLCLPLLFVAITPMTASNGEAQKKAKPNEVHFLRIGTPQDSEVYGAGATCVSRGILQLDESRKKINSLVVLARVYGPHKKGFIIHYDSWGEIEKPLAGTNCYPFQAAVVLPSDSGTYLLKVDCIDLNFKHPKNLIATQSLFIEVKK